MLCVPLLGCSKEPPPEQRQADVAFQRAEQALGQGRYRESRRLLLATIPVDQKLGRLRRVGEEERLIGEGFAAIANFDSALIFYHQALEQYRGLADRNTVRSLGLDIASLHRRMGDERTAFAMYSESLRLANVFNDKEGAREIQWAMLPTCRALENRDEEYRILTDLLNYYTAKGDAGKQASLYFQSALSKVDRHEYSPALEDLLRSLTLAEQAHDSTLTINALLNLGVTYGRLGKLSESFQAYAEGLKRSDVTRGAEQMRLEMLLRVGNAYLVNRQYGEARRFYRAALNGAQGIQNKLAEGYAFIQLGHCDLPASVDAAVKNYQPALELFEGVSYSPGSAYALFSLGVAAQRTGHLTDALQRFEGAVEQSEASFWRPPDNEVYQTCEEAFYDAHQTGPYDGILELLLQLGRNDEAFWYVERKHGRTTFDQLSELDLQTADGRVDSLLNIYRHARGLHIGAERQLSQTLMSGFQNREMIRDIGDNVERAARTMNDVGTRITEIDPVFQPAVSIAGIGLADAQKLLPSGSALIESVPTGRTLYTFIVTNAKSSLVVAAVTRERVERMTRDFLEQVRMRGAYVDSAAAVQRPIDRRLQDAATELYDALLLPLERSLPSVDKLIVIPQQELAAVPLHLLRRAASGQYLAARYMVSYLPAAVGLAFPAMQARMRRAPPVMTNDIVALGYPGETKWDVEYELMDIRAFYKEARLYFDRQAVLANLLKEHGAVLHLAAEFGFNDDKPGNAYVVLSDGKSISSSTHVPWGQLCLLPPFTTVIVSDLGKIGPQVVPTLPLLFLMNGTSSVILNAFAPSRKAKKMFGEQFYTALLAGQSGPAAFRQAQLEMMKIPAYASPYLWGSFCLWGK